MSDLGLVTDGRQIGWMWLKVGGGERHALVWQRGKSGRGRAVLPLPPSLEQPHRGGCPCKRTSHCEPALFYWTSLEQKLTQVYPNCKLSHWSKPNQPGMTMVWWFDHNHLLFGLPNGNRGCKGRCPSWQGGVEAICPPVHIATDASRTD